MTNNISLELKQAFKAECKVIDLKQEYSGYCEDIRWAIATDLAEDALRAKYRIYLSYNILIIRCIALKFSRLNAA